jgi:pimeloyl-ACP methyl ester carboxylesterase
VPNTSDGSPVTQAVDCPITVPDGIDAECGALLVPEDYERSDGETLRLPYVILRSRSADPEPDPVIFTAGGPGYSSLDSVWLFADSLLLDDRDIIILEQRGNRYAEPALTCDPSVWWEETPGHTPCLDAIQARGIDITQYTTHNIVRDVVAFREALGYTQWNLYGSSFSTLVMLLVMEADPSGTRSAILQSVRPPNETTFAHEADSPLRAIEQVFTDCAADDRCAASYPDLADDFFALVRRLNAEPVELEIESATEGGPIPIALDGYRFIDWIAVNQLYGPVFPHHDAAYLPLLIDEVDRGNVRPLEIAAENHWNAIIENPNWAWGLMFAISCQQDMPAAGPSRPETDLAASERLEGFARSTSQREICATWALAPLPPAGTDYVESDVPALVLAGSYDPVTPPIWSRTTAEHLPNSTYVEFPGRGHDVTSDNACAAMLEALFLTDPTTKLDTSCVETAPRPSFVLPDDVYRAPGLARSGEDVSLGSPGGVAWIEALAAVSILGLFSLAAILVGLGLLWLARTRRRTHKADRTALVAYVLASLIVLTTIAISLLTTQLNDDYASRGSLAFSLGPSRDLASAVLLAWISPLAGVVILTLAAMTIWAWLTHRWHGGFRILTTLTVLCSLVIVMLGVRWGLFTMLV